MAEKHFSRDIHARIFHKLLDVVPDLLTIEDAGKSKVEGYMDLGLDVLFRSPEKLVIALSHYYKHPSPLLTSRCSITSSLQVLRF